MGLILIYGTDFHLLESRHWLLEAQGYRVLTARSLAEFPPSSVSVALLLVCHTVPLADRDRAFEILSHRWPTAHKLSLVSIGSACRPAEECFNTMEGPGRLIQRVDQLITARPN